jgi:hypothetical protein
MALIISEKTEYALCHVVLKENEKIISTSHFIADTEYPLWRFSDSAMHQNCFLEWDKRQTFVDKYNETIGNITWGNGTYHHMNDDGVIVSLRREHQEKD